MLMIVGLMCLISLEKFGSLCDCVMVGVWFRVSVRVSVVLFSMR